MCILFYYYIPKDFARKSNKVVVPKSNDIIFSKSHRKSIYLITKMIMQQMKGMCSSETEKVITSIL